MREGGNKKNLPLSSLATMIAVYALSICSCSYAGTWYVSPEGLPKGHGTITSPWDIQSTFAGKQRVRPGDTIYLLEGIYRFPKRNLDSFGYQVVLKGTKDMPIHISSAPGHHAVIDGGIVVQEGCEYLYLENMEITVSENSYMTRTLTETGSHPKSYGRMWGGLNIVGGNYCKYINLVVHDCAVGIAFWQGAKDSLIYGCIIYDNGWTAPDRGHGHAIYTQNKDGWKIIENCIMTGGYGFTMHGYTSPVEKDSYVDNYQARRNICYSAGTFLFGGDKPSKNILLVENVFYRLPQVQLGWVAPFNQNCELYNNYFIKTPLVIKDFREVKQEGNVDVGNTDASANHVFVYENQYDSNRAHVAVFSGTGGKTVDIDVSGFLNNGDAYCFLNPRDLWGTPAKEGIYHGERLDVPVNGQFAAFVLLKSSDGKSPQSKLGKRLEVVPASASSSRQK